MRVAEDRASFFYFNINSQQVVHHLPPQAFSADRTCVQLISPPNLKVLCQQIGAPGVSAASVLPSRAEEATFVPGELGAIPHPAIDNPARHGPPLAHPRLAPPALTHILSAAQQLQQAMARGMSPTDDASWDPEAFSADLEARFAKLTELQVAMAESLNKMVNDVSDFGAVQLTWVGKGKPYPPASEIARLCTVSDALSKSLSVMTKRTCALIYAVGGTWVSFEELTLVQGQQPSASASAGAFSAFLPDSLASVQSRQHSTASASTSENLPSWQSFAVDAERARLLNLDTGSPPPNVTARSRKVVQWLSRLVLSAETLIKLARIEASPSITEEKEQEDKVRHAAASAGPDPQANLACTVAIVNTRLDARKQRVRLDATELLRAASTLSGELDQLRTKAAESVMAGLPLSADVYPAGTDWPRRTHGILLSGAGETGINVHTMSGGSAAGWRGNGFVLPSVAQMRALRTETDPFVDSFDVAARTSALVDDGLDTIRRQPIQALATTAPVIQAVAGQSNGLRARLAELIALATASSTSSRAPRSLPPCGGVDANALLETAKLVLFRAGTFVSLLEEIDLASSLDYDAGAGEDGTRAQRAAVHTVQFIQLKQDLYDAMADVFVEAQDAVIAVGILEEPYIPQGAAARVAHCGNVLTMLTEATTSTLGALADLADMQSKAGSHTLGARGHVCRALEHPTPTRINECQSSYPSNAPAVSSTTSCVSPRAVPSVTGLRSDAAQSQNSGFMCLGPCLDVSKGPDGTWYDSLAGAQGSSKPGSHHTSVSAAPPNPVPHNAQSAPPTGTTGPWSSLLQHSTSAALSSSLNPLYSRIAGHRTAQSSLVAPSYSTLASIEAGPSSFAPLVQGSDDLGMDQSSVLNEKIRRLQGEELPGNSTPTSPPTPRSAVVAPLSTLPPLLSPTSTVAEPTSPSPTLGTGNSVLPTLAFSPLFKTDKMPWLLEPGILPGDMVITPDGHVKGATLEALMARLTIHDNFDAPFNSTFLLTYRSFTTTETFLDLLFKRFKVMMPEGLTPAEQLLWTDKTQRPIQLRVFNVMKSWLETYHYPNTDGVFYPLIRTFVQKEMSALPSMKLASTQLLRLIDKREFVAHHEALGSSSPSPAPHRALGTLAPQPIFPRNLKRIKLLDLEPLEVARQLTVKESDAFRNIKPSECLNKSWCGPQGDVKAPGIRGMIATSNLLMTWVTTGILESTDTKKRALVLRHWIAIAEQAQQLQNYATMSTISSALNSSPILRLRKTWEQVHPRAKHQLDQLTRIMDSNKNFSSYREIIRNLNPPCIPFLGVYLTDLVFIQDGNPDFLKDSHLINFGKRHKTAEVIKKIMIHQSMPYVPCTARLLLINSVLAYGTGNGTDTCMH